MFLVFLQTVKPITTAKSVTKPMTKSVTKPLTNSVIKPVTESVTKPLTDSLIKPVIQPVIKPVTESVTEAARKIRIRPSRFKDPLTRLKQKLNHVLTTKLFLAYGILPPPPLL